MATSPDGDVCPCLTCFGEGVEECDDLECDRPHFGEMSAWHDCRNCGGSGRSEDQSWW